MSCGQDLNQQDSLPHDSFTLGKRTLSQEPASHRRVTFGAAIYFLVSILFQMTTAHNATEAESRPMISSVNLTISFTESTDPESHVMRRYNRGKPVPAQTFRPRSDRQTICQAKARQICADPLKS
jgi:hypothetical protein